MLRLAPPDDSGSSTPFEPIVRDRLLRRFSACATARVTLVVAPAGFGKSVAIQHFLESQGADYTHFALRREHGSILGFLRGFTTAIRVFAADAVRSVATAYEQNCESRDATAHWGAWLSTLLATYRGTIVIDDFQRAESEPRISELLSEVIERSPPSIKWILAARDLLELPISSWVAYGLASVPIDQTDLELTIPEASDVARALDLHLDTPELSDLLTLTKAWPAAFTFALRVAARVTAYQEIANGTREMIYAFLAQQVLLTLDEAERQFLFDTALLPSLEVGLLEAVGYPAAVELLDRVRRRTAFVSAEGNGVFRYHDLFREFLVDRLIQEGSDRYCTACLKAAHVLSQTGRVADALALYTKARSVDYISRLISAHGFDLVDRGMSDIIERAIAVVPEAYRNQSASLLGVRGVIAAFRGRYPEAEDCFKRSLRTEAATDMRVEIALRYSNMLIWPAKRCEEASHLLETIHDDDLVDDRMRARYYARKAVIFSHLSAKADAAEFADRARIAAQYVSDDAVRITVLNSLAIVALNGGSPAKAAALARQAVREAERSDSAYFAATVGTTLVWCTFGSSDFAACYRALADLRRASERCGWRLGLRYCVMVEYDLAVRRGDAAKVEELEETFLEEIKGFPPTYDGAGHALALRRACLGNFRGAFLILWQQHSIREGPLAAQATTTAHAFVYAGVAGLRAEAEEAAKETERIFGAMGAEEFRDGLAANARAMLALGYALQGWFRRSKAWLEALERDYGSLAPESAQLIRAIRAVYMRFETGAWEHDLAVELKSLAATTLGGYSTLLKQLLLEVKPFKATFAALTKTELRILRLLSSGTTSRDAAASLGCSAQTIDTHARSIARKLGCRGRREAIALARAHGIF